MPKLGVLGVLAVKKDSSSLINTLRGDYQTVAQAEENAGAMEFGPLSDEQMRQVDEILKR